MMKSPRRSSDLLAVLSGGWRGGEDVFDGVGAGAEEAGGKIGGGERGGSENFIRRVGIALDWMIAVQMA